MYKPERDKVLIELSTVPFHMISDYITRNDNIQAGRELCDRCEGTGNELFSMLRVCTECRGEGWKGIKPDA